MADLGRWLSGDYRVESNAPEWPEEAPPHEPGIPLPSDDGDD
jgi:endogenous inhibitor of DNA gyrase (YacG/DUF329 family)